MFKTPFKRLCDGPTDGPTDGWMDQQTKKWLIESRSTRLKRKGKREREINEEEEK